MLFQGHIGSVNIWAVISAISSVFVLNGSILAESGLSGNPAASSETNAVQYTHDNPENTSFVVGEDTDRQYEKIIIRRILREQEASPDSDVTVNQPTDSDKPFSIYGFNVIPETAVSTMFLIGSFLIFRHRKRG